MARGWRQRQWVTVVEALPGADLGGSSDYSSARLEGLRGEGFREQVTLPRLSRQLKTREKPLVGKFHCEGRAQRDQHSHG